MRDLLSLAALAALSSCVDAPTDRGGATSIEVVSSDPNPTADGSGTAEIRITFDEASELFRREVEVRASSGRLGVGGLGEPGRFDATVPESGVVVVPLRFGREPGPVLVEVRTRGYVASDAGLVLGRRAPDWLALAADTAEVAADGRHGATLSVELGVDDPPAMPSHGAVVYLRACCARDGAPRACARPPLVVPARATLSPDSGTERLEVAVTAPTVAPVEDPDNPGLSRPADPFAAFVVASVEGAPGCGVPSGPKAGLLEFRVVPQ